MPTPFSAMARLASALAPVDASDEQSVDDFYVHVFPAFSEPVREQIFEWLSALDVEPSTADIERFASKMRQRRDFTLARTDIVGGSQTTGFENVEHPAAAAVSS